MGKRSGRKRKRQKTAGCFGREEELISNLPNDVLIRVLSLLAPKEVIRCGVLSRRWTSLPKLVPMRLRFAWDNQSLMDETETEFTHQVDQVLDSYPGESLLELDISFRFGMLDQRSRIDKWLQFAMGKKVVKFSLDLYGFMGECLSPKYEFPSIRSHQTRLPMFTSLTDLRLVCVTLTNMQVKHFLECCPFLISFCVRRSNRLTSLKVDSPRLKFLDIQGCDELRVFEVSAPNLVSFKYVQYQSKIMPLKRAPQLNELLLGYGYLIDNIHLFTSYFDHIQTLSLVVDLPEWTEFRWPIRIPTLRKLKYLTIQYERFIGDCLLSFCSWIEASPVLVRFVFEKTGCFSFTSRERVQSMMCPHQLLKEFEFVGYSASHWDNEFVNCIIENAVNLDKMVINCRPNYNRNPCKDPRFVRGMSLSAKRSARKYKSMLSPTVKFIIM